MKGTKPLEPPNTQLNLRRKLHFDQGKWCKTVLSLHITVSISLPVICIKIETITDQSTSSAAACASKDKEVPPTSNGNTSININDIELGMKELLAMTANVEEPEEVEDLYHLRLPPHKRKPAPAKALTASIETTPTKNMSTAIDGTLSPRRSPRGHSTVGGLYIIIKFSINDLVGVDHRLDIPKIMIMAHKDTKKGQTVKDLRQCLSDKTEDRLKLEFDLCMYFHVFVH